jgi:nitric oxide reductase NorQ protein
MPATVTSLTTPAEIETMADDYVKILGAAKLPFDRSKLVADMKKKAADQQNPPMDVSSWEAMHAAAGATSSPPPSFSGSAPTNTKKKSPGKVKIEEETPPTGEGDISEVIKDAKTRKERGVVREIDPDYFYISPENKAAFGTWLALNDAGIAMHLMAVGPAGCGKTSSFAVIGKEAGIPVYKVDCAAITTIDRWLGHKDVRVTEKGPETTYVLSEFLRWISGDGFDPGIVVLDEITRVPGAITNILMSILDGSQSVWVPELGITIKVHPKTRFAAAANIGAGFSGTFALDQALQDRFGVTLEFSFPSAAEEEKILVQRTGIDPDPAQKLVKIAAAARQKADAGDLSKPLSTRALLNAGHWIAAGRTVTDACEATFVKQYSQEGGGSSERTQIKLLITGIAGGK